MWVKTDTIGNYEINEKGEIRNRKNNRIIKPFKNKNGYIYVKKMKKAKTLCYLIALGVIVWSVLTDISTYNVYFISEKNIVLYCIDGIIFNAPKIILPLVIGLTIDVYERIVAVRENRVDRCR